MNNDDDLFMKLYLALKTSEPFKDDDSLTLESFSEIYPKLNYENFIKGQNVF